jgi:hypothetical protein
MTTQKPFSQACENNKTPILQVIKDVYPSGVTVLEIGSGTGQHAYFFAKNIPDICWQPSDKEENITGIQAWCEDEPNANLKTPIVLDVTVQLWPINAIEALFTANTLHIISWDVVQVFFERIAENLNLGAVACIYGPFNYNGTYTSASNASFDTWLKNRDPLSGIRDFEAVLALAVVAGLVLLQDVAMPANNRLLVLQKVER